MKSFPKSTHMAIGIILVFLAALILLFHMIGRYYEAEWDRYIRCFHYVHSIEEAVSRYGEPLDIEYNYNSKRPEEITYVTLKYEGFSFGISGTPKGRICCIWVTEKGIMPLRNGVDIGSSREEAESAYEGESKIKDLKESESGFILTHHGQKFYEGIYLYFYFDESDRLCRIAVTDGF